MARRLLITVVIAACAAATVAGCSSSSGTHVQSVPPTTSQTSSPSTTPSASAPTTEPTTGPVTTGFGAAQPAVDVVVRVQSAYVAAVRHPSSSSSSTFDRYLAGQAKIAFDSSLKSAKSAGVEYRGTPPAPRMRVVSSTKAGSLPEIVVENCPLNSTTDPFVAYYTKTGKVAPVSKPKVPQPYAQTAKVFEINGSWVITSFTTDDTKTCQR